jgi:SPP1 gp7 family putative phage head morphogenesis protein
MYIESKLSKKLYESLGEDVENLKKKVANNISRGIASNMHYSDIARNIANNSKTGLNRAMTITRTEGNRIYNAAALDGGVQAKEKTGADLIKQWDSTLDGLTRPNHRKLDGQIRELDEDFEVNGRKAPAPLQFNRPEEDINCRCISLIKPRWDVDEPFTKIDNKTGQLLEFEGVEDYEDFKKRYWESVDKTVDKSVESGIMESGGKITLSNFTQIEKFEQQARDFYNSRIKNDVDVKAISKNTDFNYDDILAIKNHIMVKEHLFKDGTIRKFDPDIDQALAWQRLMEGRATDNDILFLNHELTELKYMNENGCDYETAHNFSTKQYDWQSAVDSVIDKDEINSKWLK